MGQSYCFFIPSINIFIDVAAILRDLDFVVTLGQTFPHHFPAQIINCGLGLLLVCLVIRFGNLQIFPSQRCPQSFHHKTFRCPRDCTMGRSVGFFDPVISPLFIFRPFVQFQQNLGVLDSISFSTFLYQFLSLSFLPLVSQHITAFLLSPFPFFLEYSKLAFVCKLLLLPG